MRVLFCAFLGSALAVLSGFGETTFGPGQVIYENGDPSPTIGTILAISVGTAEGNALPHSFIVTEGEALYFQEQSAIGVFERPVPVSSELSNESNLQIFSRNIDGLHGDDLLLLRGSANVFEWYPNTSAGEWGPAVTIEADGNLPAGAAIADLNNDQASDIAVVMSSDFECVWYRQDPVSHSFTKQSLSGSTGVDTFPQTVVVGDINGDTFPDILTAARSPGEVFAYVASDASGNFGSLTSLFLHDPGVTELHLHDVDLDGDLDLFVFEPYGVRSSLTLYKNDGVGSFSDPVVIFEGQAATWYTAFGDLDNDGDTDVVVMNGGTASRFRPDFLHWFENDATGTYPTTPTTITLPSNLARGELGLADVDADGDLDIITASRRLTTVEWFENLLPEAVDPIEAWARAFDPDIDVALTSDADNDGADLLLEFAFNLDPLVQDALPLREPNGTSGLPNAAIELGESAKISGTFIRRRDHEVLNLVYQVQVGTDLITWDDLAPGDATAIDDDYERVSFAGTIPAAGDRYFQRLRVAYRP